MRIILIATYLTVAACYLAVPLSSDEGTKCRDVQRHFQESTCCSSDAELPVRFSLGQSSYGKCSGIVYVQTNSEEYAQGVQGDTFALRISKTNALLKSSVAHYLAHLNATCINFVTPSIPAATPCADKVYQLADFTVQQVPWMAVANKVLGKDLTAPASGVRVFIRAPESGASKLDEYGVPVLYTAYQNTSTWPAGTPFPGWGAYYNVSGSFADVGKQFGQQFDFPAPPDSNVPSSPFFYFDVEKKPDYVGFGADKFAAVGPFPGKFDSDPIAFEKTYLLGYEWCYATQCKDARPAEDWYAQTSAPWMHTMADWVKASTTYKEYAGVQHAKALAIRQKQKDVCAARDTTAVTVFKGPDGRNQCDANGIREAAKLCYVAKACADMAEAKGYSPTFELIPLDEFLALDPYTTAWGNQFWEYHAVGGDGNGLKYFYQDFSRLEFLIETDFAGIPTSSFDASFAEDVAVTTRQEANIQTWTAGPAGIHARFGGATELMNYLGVLAQDKYWLETFQGEGQRFIADVNNLLSVEQKATIERLTGIQVKNLLWGNGYKC